MAYKAWQSFVPTEIGPFLHDQLAIQTKKVLGSVRVGSRNSQISQPQSCLKDLTDSRLCFLPRWRAAPFWLSTKQLHRQFPIRKKSTNHITETASGKARMFSLIKQNWTKNDSIAENIASWFAKWFLLVFQQRSGTILLGPDTIRASRFSKRPDHPECLNDCHLTYLSIRKHLCQQTNAKNDVMRNCSFLYPCSLALYHSISWSLGRELTI